jgi:GT2 family glycosyltransferase
MPENENEGQATTDDDSLDVGVVIVTFNSAGVLDRLLPTLARGLDGVAWRAVVVDNASTDDTVAIARSAGLDVVALDRNVGYAAAINHGARTFPGARSVLVLNPDVELVPGCAAALYRQLANERVGIVAPKMFVDEQTMEPSQRRDPSLLRTWGPALLGGAIADHFSALSESVADPRMYERERDVDWAVGAVLLVGRDCSNAIGEWDESLFLYSEETDYCMRARAAGYAVRYTPDAVVYHPGGDGLVNPRLRAIMTVNRVRVYRRSHGVVASWCFFAGALFHEVTRAAAGRRASRTAALALVSPRRRPAELNAATSLMPR